MTLIMARLRELGQLPSILEEHRTKNFVCSFIIDNSSQQPIRQICRRFIHCRAHIYRYSYGAHDDAISLSIASAVCGAHTHVGWGTNKDDIIIKGFNRVNRKMATDLISYGYAAIVLTGGVVGYVKAGKCQ